MTAAYWNTPEVVQALIKAGANIHARDENGRTALDFSRMNKKLKNEDIINRLKREIGYNNM